MKKLFIFILLFVATHAHAGTAVIGTHHKQIGNTLLFADDIKVLNFEGISTIGLATGGGGISDATFSGYTAGADLQNAYNKGSTINTNPTNNSVEFRYGGDDGEIFKLSKDGGAPVFLVTTSSVTFMENIAVLEDRKTSGVSGGTCTLSSYIQRDLNVVALPRPFVNLSTNSQFKLQAGTYYIWAAAPAQKVSYHRANIYNVTDSTYLTDTDSVSNPLNHSGTAVNTSSSIARLYGRFTIASPKVFSLVHRCAVTVATIGFGLPYGAFSEPEIYGRVFIRREK